MQHYAMFFEDISTMKARYLEKYPLQMEEEYSLQQWKELNKANFIEYKVYYYEN